MFFVFLFIMISLWFRSIRWKGCRSLWVQHISGPLSRFVQQCFCQTMENRATTTTVLTLLGNSVYISSLRVTGVTLIYYSGAWGFRKVNASNHLCSSSVFNAVVDHLGEAQFWLVYWNFLNSNLLLSPFSLWIERDWVW